MKLDKIDSKIRLEYMVRALKIYESTPYNLLADLLRRIVGHLVAESVQSIFQERLSCRCSSKFVKCIFNLIKRQVKMFRHLWYGNVTSKVA